MKLRSQKLVVLACSALLATSLFAGCEDGTENLNAPSGQVANAAPVTPPVNAETDLPGQEVVGEAGDSTVYSLDGELYVVTEVETEWFLQNFEGAQPVPGARIIFPDGGELVTDANGDFDASQSTYASSGAAQNDRFDTEVTIVPPAELGLDAVQSDLLVPTPGEDATIEVVFIPEGAVPEEPPVPGPMPDVRAQGYIWSTNPADYLATQIHAGSAEWLSAPEHGPLYLGSSNVSAVKFLFKFNNVLTWFDVHAYYAGTDQPVPREILKTNAVAFKTASHTQWRVSVYREGPGSGLAAIWVSPNHYFGVLSHNVHLALVQF